MTPVSSPPPLVAALRLFAELLLVELDQTRLALLQDEALRPALEALGISIPTTSDLEDLAAEFCDCFLHPSEGAAPIQSLWTSGGYEGASAQAIRDLAAEAGFELDHEACRHAPPDHAGVILLLYCEVQNEEAEIAAKILAAHTAWIERALENVRQRSGFYGVVAAATLDLLAQLRNEHSC